MQKDKKTWSLQSDEKLFEKLKQLEDNVIASTHLVHNSLTEVNKAYKSADTTLNNTINAFNQLNFNKFVENVVEDQEDGMMQHNENLNFMDQTSMLGDLKTEE